MTETRVDLVLEGGGVKGIGLVGAVAALEERGLTPHRVAGTSAGAIVGSLVASGLPASRLKEIMQSVDYNRFKDKGWLDKVGILGKGISLLFEGGIYEGDYLKSFLGEVLQETGRTTFGDLADDDDDPQSATSDPARRSKLVVMVSDVSNGRLARLPWDYHDYYADEEMDPGDRPIAEAVRASMSLPFFYEPAAITYRRDGEQRRAWAVDGGMLSNFPIAVFDREGGEPRWPTIGVKLSARPTAEAPPLVDDDPNPIELAMAMIGTMTDFFDKQHMEDPDILDRTCFVDNLGVKTTEFDLSRDRSDALYESGHAAMVKYLDNHPRIGA